MKPFIPIRAAGSGCGNKAVILGQLIRAGFRVPEGFVLPADAATGWEHVLPEVIHTLGGARFAVRSSGLAEDGHATSFAGQFHTSLNVPAANIAAEVQQTTVAVEAARAYAAATGQPTPRQVAVIIQRMVAPAAAGVAFTRDPLTGDRTVVIEAVHGLGDRLVSGDQHPERWRHAASEVPRCSSTPAVLSVEQVIAVSQVAIRIEEFLGRGQDVEWAIADGQVWVLQSRPITHTPETDIESTTSQVHGSVPEAQVASGTPSSPGIAQGRVRHVLDFDDFNLFTSGEVLVCAATSPAWTPLIARAAAVITTRGGILSHTAIVAREFGIPAITAVNSAFELPHGALVRVDGTNGIITTQEGT